MLVRHLLFALAAIAASAAAPPKVPAFPGAEGYGAGTPGGRGGRILIVRSLNDSGPGSFREAIEAKGPRIVVFRVGGIIDLKSDIRITEPYLTIAGQSAPGDGICLRGGDVSIDTHDVIVRYLRVRPGDTSGRILDAISVGGNSRDVILDHCSVSWSIDESLSPSGAISNVTVQWSIIAEALNNSIHNKGPHGYGSLVRAIGGLTMHHNLWAHNNARNPRLGDNYLKPPFPTFDIRNNVMYDFGHICSGMTGDHFEANYVGNYIRPGPSSHTERAPIVLTDKAAVKYYVTGNVVEGRPAMTANNATLFDRPERVAVMDRPFATAPVRTTTAEVALKEVLAGAGATRPVRDAADARIVNQVLTRTGAIIDSQAEVGGWPSYKPGRPPLDTDRDGMPDAWEKVHKLNPRDPSDASAGAGNDGYTNIEAYLNGLARTQPVSGSK